MSNIDACQDSFKKIIQLAADALSEPPGDFHAERAILNEVNCLRNDSGKWTEVKAALAKHPGAGLFNYPHMPEVDVVEEQGSEKLRIDSKWSGGKYPYEELDLATGVGVKVPWHGSYDLHDSSDFKLFRTSP